MNMLVPRLRVCDGGSNETPVAGVPVGELFEEGVTSPAGAAPVPELSCWLAGAGCEQSVTPLTHEPVTGSAMADSPSPADTVAVAVSELLEPPSLGRRFDVSEVAASVDGSRYIPSTEAITPATPTLELDDCSGCSFSKETILPPTFCECEVVAAGGSLSSPAVCGPAAESAVGAGLSGF